jgi:hypothetical protein
VERADMKIYNVKEVFDNGKFVTLITISGSNVNLPIEEEHSLTIEQNGSFCNVSIDFNAGFENIEELEAKM